VHAELNIWSLAGGQCTEGGSQTRLYRHESNMSACAAPDGGGCSACVTLQQLLAQEQAKNADLRLELESARAKSTGTSLDEGDSGCAASGRVRGASCVLSRHLTEHAVMRLRRAAEGRMMLQEMQREITALRRSAARKQAEQEKLRDAVFTAELQRDAALVKFHSEGQSLVRRIQVCVCVCVCVPPCPCRQKDWRRMLFCRWRLLICFYASSPAAPGAHMARARANASRELSACAHIGAGLAGWQDASVRVCIAQGRGGSAGRGRREIEWQTALSSARSAGHHAFGRGLFCSGGGRRSRLRLHFRRRR